MTRFLHLLLIGLALLMMGAKDLPRPCIGDGQGNPCAVERCQCTVRCSCKASCSPEVAKFAAARAEELPTTPPMCSTTALATPLQMPAQDAPAQAACHVAGSEGPSTGLTHFALPNAPAPMLLSAPLGARLTLLSGDDGQPFEPAPFASRTLCPPEHPPRIRG